MRESKYRYVIYLRTYMYIYNYEYIRIYLSIVRCTYISIFYQFIYIIRVMYIVRGTYIYGKVFNCRDCLKRVINASRRRVVATKCLFQSPRWKNLSSAPLHETKKIPTYSYVRYVLEYAHSQTQTATQKFVNALLRAGRVKRGK